MSVSKRVRLVELQFHPDDLAFIVTALGELGTIKNDRAEQSYNLGDNWGYDFFRREAFRCCEIARAIALASKPD